MNTDITTYEYESVLGGLQLLQKYQEIKNIL